MNETVTFKNAETALQCIAEVSSALQFIIMSLQQFTDKDIDHKYLNIEEWGGVRRSLNCALLAVEDCFHRHSHELQDRRIVLSGEGEEGVNDIPEFVASSQNPIIANGVLGTLEKMIDSLQCFSTLFAHVKAQENEKLFSPVEIAGLVIMLRCIKSAAVDCQEHFEVVPSL